MIKVSAFRGFVKGSRGEATRLGGAESGISSGVNSWRNSADLHLRNFENDKGTGEALGITIKGEDDLLLDIQDLNISFKDFKVLAKYQDEVKIFLKQYQILNEIGKTK